ncbi:MAG: glucose-1-phosphate adenylyltransferase family protein [Thermoplasmata archaeon]
MQNTIAFVLAGGRVDELSVLTHYTPKSGLTFGGCFRIIDFPLTYLLKSNIQVVGVLAQFRASSLIDHLGSGESWDFIGKNRVLKVLPPSKGQTTGDWYKGTADAVYQNIDFIEQHNPDYVLVLSGDHVITLDYHDVVRQHITSKADLTIGFVEVPQQEASRYGIGVLDENLNLVSYEEKPRRPKSNLASLTVYVFNRDVLVKELRKNAETGKSHEFGKDIIPAMLGNYKIMGYLYKGFWGYTRTVEEYYNANFMLLEENPPLDIFKLDLRTNIKHRGIGDRPPALFYTPSEAVHSLISNGCIIKGKVEHSILSPGVIVEKGAHVVDSIIFHDTIIGEGTTVSKCIVDKDVRIGRNTVVGWGEDLKANEEYPKLLYSGITLVGRSARIPDGTRIGRNVVVYPYVQESDFSLNTIDSGGVVKEVEQSKV